MYDECKPERRRATDRARHQEPRHRLVWHGLFPGVRGVLLRQSDRLVPLPARAQRPDARHRAPQHLSGGRQHRDTALQQLPDALGGDRRRLATGLILTAILGAIFVSGQVAEYFLLLSEGLGPSSNIFGSAFFTM